MRTFSGVPFHMVKALRRHFPDLYLANSAKHRVARGLIWRALDLTGGRLRLEWTRWGARALYAPLWDELKQIQPDLVICIGNSPLAAVLGAEFAVVHVTDATFRLMENYYETYWKIPVALRDAPESLERSAIRQAVLCLYSSQWAADSAIADYQADPQRVAFIPWGCNREDQADEPAAHPPGETCQLVFAGMDWVRKGGDMAVATARALHAAGVPVHLHLIGATPPPGCEEPYITAYGVISKATPEGVARFNGLLAGASFLLAPTRQDCTPMAFSEANFYGVPVISTRTGGVASVIRDGANGFLLDPHEDADAFAALVARIWQDRPLYDRLRQTSRLEYLERLNWDVWADHAAALIERAAALAKSESTTAGLVRA